MKTSNLICIDLFNTGFKKPISRRLLFCLSSSYCILFVPSKEGYLQLASLAHGQGKKLFRVRPKVHMMVEIGLLMQEQGQNGRLAMSPIATCTWSDEDFIGRISRCSRSSHGATISVSTMKKSLGMYSIQLKHLSTKKRQWWRWKSSCSWRWVAVGVGFFGRVSRWKTKSKSWNYWNHCKAKTTKNFLENKSPGILMYFNLRFMILLLPDLDLPSCAYVLTVLPLQQHKSLLLRYYPSLPRVHLHLRQMLLVSTSVRSWSIWDSRQVRILLATPSVDFMVPNLAIFITLYPCFKFTAIDSRPDKAELRSFKLCKGPQSWQRLTSWMGPLWQILLLNVFRISKWHLAFFMFFSVIPKKTFAYICYEDAWQSSFKRVTLESYCVWYGPRMIILTWYVIPSRVDLF